MRRSRITVRWRGELIAQLPLRIPGDQDEGADGQQQKRAGERAEQGRRCSRSARL